MLFITFLKRQSKHDGMIKNIIIPMYSQSMQTRLKFKRERTKEE